jgi:hypothetical protein
MAPISKTISIALANLTPRQKEVLVGRFGLEKKDGKRETLAAIGDRMDVTRERIRQIESAAIVLAKENILKNNDIASSLKKISGHIKENGGAVRKDAVVRYASAFLNGANGNHIDFLGEASGFFNLRAEDNDYFPFYYLAKKDMKVALAFVDNWTNYLKSRKQKVFSDSYQATLASFLKIKPSFSSVAENYLSLSKRIRKNPYGDIGLREWPEINPTTIRDKIYLIMKKKKEPLHFESIADTINNIRFDDHVALTPTVHNELIKDDRFSLVGRGMYGLREYGYESGTAREAIANVLKKKGPLVPADVVSHVNQKYSFRQNTILINLQNKNFFERMRDGTYRVRES